MVGNWYVVYRDESESSFTILRRCSHRAYSPSSPAGLRLIAGFAEKYDATKIHVFDEIPINYSISVEPGNDERQTP